MRETGLLSLEAKKRHARTKIHGYYEGAFKFTRPVRLDDDSLSVYLIHVGGGYVDGDTYESTITLGEGAELAVTSQASTKVYKTPSRPVEQHTNIQLAADSVLEYFLDPLILYEGARFIQNTTIELESDAVFFYSDIITPGWSEDGVNFRYDWVRNKLKVYQNGKLVLFDHLLLEPDEELEGVLQLEGHTHVGSFVLFHPNATRELAERLYENVYESFPDVRLGISDMEDGGIVVRILSDRTQTIERIISHIHTFARGELLDKGEISWRKY
ncbi:urease accessory protein UreD [Halobacillus halophilus]|uniref:urease accessory protein UreD n=1 Tax=Halobacillus halophilus TaxID=1570 RepID=UPI001CD528C6|nr:urease accessory protein UreD [Halobacillus halophilus]MCA1010597.1 urease accessory protein UreD [Halobacillus halophilus]